MEYESFSYFLNGIDWRCYDYNPDSSLVQFLGASTFLLELHFHPHGRYV